jgi:Flp pilus assembly protein TadD
MVITLKRRFAPLLCALFFTVHPIHTESVTWIAGRTDVLSATFFLAALLLYIKSVSTGHGKGIYFYLGSLTAFAVSLFAKEMSITLLPVIILYDCCFREVSVNQRTGGRYSRYSGYLAVTVLYLAGKFLLYSRGFEISLYPGGNLYTSVLTMSKAVVFYIRKLIVPVNLSISHLFPVSISVLDPHVLVSISIITALVVTAVMIRKRSRETSFSIGYFFITLLPVCHLIPIPGGVVAERYLYIPSIGFVVFLAILLDKISRSYGRRYAIVISMVILALYSMGTMKRNRDWRDETTLWTKTIDLYPGNGAAYLYRGHTYWERGIYPESVSDYSKAIEITPNDPEGYVSRGVSRTAMGEIDNAIADFTRAIELDSLNVKPFYNRGISYAQLGRFDEAISDFNRVVTLAPDNVEAYNNRGVVHSRMESYDKALLDFTRAIELNPDHARAYQNRGLLYRILEKEDLAERDEDKARFLNRSSGIRP